MLTLIKQVLRDIAACPDKSLWNADLRQLIVLRAKLRRYPRFQEAHIRFNGCDIVIPDAASFLSNFSEIFVNKIYDFNWGNPDPVIIDLGANVGLSVLYFKRRFPHAHITAFEADPKIYEYLKLKIHGNGHNDVVLINKAVWNRDGVIQFSSEGADGGQIGIEGENVVQVKAVNIANVLRETKCDFLKMDIEGAEEKVIPACADLLHDALCEL
jgi:FkbM family methyltransferase